MSWEGHQVYIYKEGMDLPSEGTYYVVCGNGIWMHKNNGVCECFIPVDNISSLDDFNNVPSVQLLLPKMPIEYTWKIKEFFRRIVALYRSECEVTLYLHRETREFKVIATEQSVSHTSVSYKRSGVLHVDELKDYNRVGTIHSHCDFSAFHSGTDTDDEADFDGFHVTFGHNDRSEFSISASVVANGFRTLIDPVDTLEGIVGTEGGFQLSGITDEQVAAWTPEVEEWVAKVTPMNRWGYSSVNNLDQRWFFKQGDLVGWSNSPDATNFHKPLGQGPFEVLAFDGSKLTIRTSTGTANLCASFFVKWTAELNEELIASEVYEKN